MSVIELLTDYHRQIEDAFLAGRMSPYQLNKRLWSIAVQMSRQLATNPVCTWTLQVDAHLYEPEYYDTGCGQAFLYVDGGENHYHYCPNCGRLISEKREEPET